MKTVLYIDTRDFMFKTFHELKNEYLRYNGSIDDEDMLKVIEDNGLFRGGDFCVVEDEILDWCNDYFDYIKQGDNLGSCDRDVFVRDLYIEFSCNFRNFVKSVKGSLLGFEEGRALLDRLSKFCDDSKYL